MEQNLYILIEENGETYLIDNQEPSSLAMLQFLVDGLIECVALPENVLGFAADLWVNEEGLFRPDFTGNIGASILAGRPLVGPAVITRTNRAGETIGITDDQLNFLIEDGFLLDCNDGAGFDREAIAEFRREREAVA